MLNRGHDHLGPPTHAEIKTSSGTWRYPLAHEEAIMALGGFTAERISMHLQAIHIPNPYVMQTNGFQFDAEVAAMFGFALNDVADVASQSIAGLLNLDEPDSTGSGMTTFSRVAHLFSDPGTESTESAEQAADFYTNEDFMGDLASETKRLLELGVAQWSSIQPLALPVIAEAIVVPRVYNEQFFTRFGVEQL